MILFADDDEYDRPNYSRFSTASYMSAMDASNIRSKKKALCVRPDKGFHHIMYLTEGIRIDWHPLFLSKV